MSGKPHETSGPELTKALRLRGDPPQVMRLSRRTLAVLGGVAAIALAAALVFALRPANRARVANETINTENQRPTELITGAPKDYSQVPKLGPPLPGDLGRPIVSAQARGVDVPAPPIGPAAEPPPSTPARQSSPSKSEVERDAARTSGLLVGLGGRTAQTPEPIGLEPTSPQPSISTSAPTTPTAGSQAAKRAFLAQDASPTTAAARLLPPASPYILQAGSVIPAALITGLRSDLPGQVTAQVTQDVYDSPTGRFLLIPQGSKLIGTYDSEITFGQSRALLAWTRLILPDGRSIVLDREPGADPQGFAGVEDRIDRHWGQIARATALSSLLGMTAELGSDGDGEIVRALRQGAQGTANQTGQQLVRRGLDVQPTLTIRPGLPVRVVVTRDLILALYDRDDRP